MNVMGNGGALVMDGSEETCWKWKDGNEMHSTKFSYIKLFH